MTKMKVIMREVFYWIQNKAGWLLLKNSVDRRSNGQSAPMAQNKNGQGSEDIEAFIWGPPATQDS